MTAATTGVIIAVTGGMIVGMTIATGATIAVTILSPLRVPAATLRTTSPAPGQQAITWDGKDVNGTAVPPGRYTVSVTATNDAGTVTRTATLVVRRA